MSNWSYENRLPWQPVQELLETRLVDQLVGRQEFGACRELGCRVIADYLGVHTRTVLNWRNRGIPFWAADRLAVQLGYHPLNVWPEEFLAVA